MAFDYKKEYKHFYLPKSKPEVIDIPPMNFVSVVGKGDPNAADGEYQTAMNVLHSLAYTIKMSYMGEHKIEGFFAYVVPPLEGLWWQDGSQALDLTRKGDLRWRSMIRLPEFVTMDVFEWARTQAETKKKKDMSAAEFFTYREGLCVQCMHIGPYDAEASTIESMEAYATAQGYGLSIGGERLHHEIYLGDPRKTNPSRLKTVIRQPIQKLD
ncbi:MAG: transcriptional regulator [Clostridiales bacterium]|nr:transcriptional regulator [Clostridiales bacterium]